MALAHDLSSIASAVLIAAGDMLFLPAEDGVDGERLSRSDATQRSAGTRPDIIPPSGGMDARADVGCGLVFAADDGVHGVAPWTSDSTEAHTRRIGPIGQSGDHTHGRPGTGGVSPSAQEGARPNGQAGVKVNGQRRLSSILDDWRDAERQLESAREADDAAEVMRLGAEVTSFADEHREVFERVLGQYAEEAFRARGRHAAVPGAAVRIAQRQQLWPSSETRLAGAPDTSSAWRHLR